MNEPSSFGYQEDPGNAGAGSMEPINPAQYKFSQDELRVLRECNSESFYQRSLPLGTLFGLGTYAAVQAGRLKPNPRFGAFPKMTLAVVGGYFLGKLSYQKACAEKLMALPGSYIGQLLRDRRDGKPGRTPHPKQSSSMLGAGPGDIYSDAGPGSALDLDTERPFFSEDNYQPPDPGDGGGPLSDVPAPVQPSMTYEDLRRRNRGQYADSRQDPYRLEPTVTPPISRPQASPPPPAPHTNKYGDIVD